MSASFSGIGYLRSFVANQKALPDHGLPIIGSQKVRLYPDSHFDCPTTRWSSDIGRLKFPPGAVPDVQHVHLLSFFHDAVNHAIDVRLMAVKQVSKLSFFRAGRASVRMLFQAEDHSEAESAAGKDVAVTDINLVRSCCDEFFPLCLRIVCPTGKAETSISMNPSRAD
jgi:hypothetical protein